MKTTDTLLRIKHAQHKGAIRVEVYTPDEYLNSFTLKNRFIAWVKRSPFITNITNL